MFILKINSKILLIYAISFLSAIALFFYWQKNPLFISKNNFNQIVNKYQDYIWFESVASQKTNFKPQLNKITIKNLEPYSLSLLVKMENQEYLTKIEKIIQKTINQFLALKFPQTEEITLPDKTKMQQKIAVPESFVWQEKKIKLDFQKIQFQSTLNFLQKENNYFGYLIIDLIDSQNKIPIQILAFSADENIIKNLAIDELVAKLKNYNNFLYTESSFLNLIQDKLDSKIFFAEIEKILIQQEGEKFQIETGAY